MSTVFIDSQLADAQRRRLLYSGEIFVYRATPAALELASLARTLLAEGFHPLDPRTAQDSLPVERFAEILSEVKPQFIHHPRCKELVPDLLASIGCDLGQTYFDVPRLRSSTSNNFLTTGISYAFHPHRDTWYSAAPSQFNWWLPIYEVEAGNVMRFHPEYFAASVPNNSETYNYYEWNAARHVAAKMISKDTRVQPHIQEDIDLSRELRIVTPVGGLMVFSAQHLHATVPNSTGVTRFSIDFRTVHRGDLEARIGAETPDARCSGTSLRDFLRNSDGERLPAEVIALYDDESAVNTDGELLYTPDESVA